MNRSLLRRACVVLLAALTLLLGCKKKNRAPDTAAVPSGQATASRNALLAYRSTGADPEGDSVAIRFDWGDGDTSDWSGLVESDAPASDTHRWVAVDTYAVRAQARDAAGTASGWSDALPVAIVANQSPNVPAIPSGPASGQRLFYHVFTTVVTDPEGDSVSYRFDWGDGDTSAWTARLASGTPGADSHSWSAADTILVRAQAKDAAEFLSDWSQPFAVTITGGWTRTFGGADVDIGRSVRQTTDGGYILTGFSYSSGASGCDLYLIKTDASGSQVWTKTFGGAQSDEGFSVQQTSDGGYIVLGGSGSYRADFWLLKTDADGNQVWARGFGETGMAEGHSVQQTSDGGYILVGRTYPPGSDSGSVWLVKTDASGNQTWAKTFGGTGHEDGYSVQQTSDGGYIVVGQTDTCGGYDSDVYLIKTDADGNQTWAKIFGGFGSDEGHSVQQTSDGGFIIAGYSEYNAGTDAHDVYLIKTDADGNQTWARRLGGPGTERGRSVQQTSDGGYIIAGETDPSREGSDDVYLVKTDASGTETWTQTYGGAAVDGGYSVRQTTDGGYIICGTTASFGAGRHDVWLIKTDANGNVE